jgi:hypothetical protein
MRVHFLSPVQEGNEGGMVVKGQSRDLFVSPAQEG